MGDEAEYSIDRRPGGGPLIEVQVGDIVAYRLKKSEDGEAEAGEDKEVQHAEAFFSEVAGGAELPVESQQQDADGHEESVGNNFYREPDDGGLARWDNIRVMAIEEGDEPPDIIDDGLQGEEHGC